MPSVLDENTQYMDSSGKPLVSGKVYFGVQGADPTVSPITIYSDRALTTIITNPQILDANGRATNKVWVSGRYSMRVDDLNDAQLYQELDNGESADKGVTALENVSGGNTITATAASTITAYEDLEQYTFRTAQVNTAAVTLNIDTVGAKSIVKNQGDAIESGDFAADTNIIVSYNLTDDVFQWVNTFNNTANKAIDFYEGTDVATATQPDIWVTDGNTFHFTGTTTVVDLADAPNIGSRRTGIADGAFTLTHGSGITLEGSANLSIVAGDRIEFYADAVDAFRAWVTKADGTAVVAPAEAGWAFVSAATASASADIQFTGFEVGFDYLIEAESVAPATDTVFGKLELGIAGPTFRATNYIAGIGGITTAGSAGGNSQTTYIPTDFGTWGNAANEEGSISFHIFNPFASTVTHTQGRAVHINNAGTLINTMFGGWHNVAESIDAVRFYFASGNIAKGEFRLYRRPNA